MSTNLSEKGLADGADSRFSTLTEVGRVFSSAVSPHKAFQQLLDILKRRHGVTRGDVFLFGPEGQDIRIEVSSGELAGHRLCEAIARRVIETGKPAVVPQVSREPLFIAAGMSDLKEEVSHICVPLVMSGKSVGAIGVDLPFRPGRAYEAEVECLCLIAALMGQAIKVQRAQRVLEDERRRFKDKDENAHLHKELTERYDFSNIVGGTVTMCQVFGQIAQVASTNTTVLICGESGTGKDLVARAIHYHSPRAKAPFIKVNCATLPEGVIESELFGYEQGAFTDAHGRKKGRFELADGGTLFLDELGDMNLSAQSKLLRVLQEREVDRLGGTMTIPINVRLIAATNKDLEKARTQGRFREDLYYRLNVFPIAVPALRDRKSDLPLLANHFLQKYSREHRREVRRISAAALDMLSAYHWPGNVRELENVIERAVLVCDSNVLHGHHLPPTLQTAQASGTVMAVSLADAVASYEKDILLNALKTTRGNRTMAAILLRSTERVINYKIRKYEIDITRFRT